MTSGISFTPIIYTLFYTFYLCLTLCLFFKDLLLQSLLSRLFVTLVFPHAQPPFAQPGCLRAHRAVESPICALNLRHDVDAGFQIKFAL